MPGLRVARPIQIALLLAMAQFAANADKAVVSVFAPDLRATFALNDAQVGSLQGGPFVIGYLLAVLWAGTRNTLPLSGRYIAGCILLWTLGAVVFATAGGYQALLLGRLILAGGQAAFIPVAVAILAGQAGSGGPAQTLSAFTASSSIGRSGGLLLGALLLVVVTTNGVATWSPWSGVSGFGVSGFGASGSGAPWRLAALAMLIPNLALAFACWRLRLGGASTTVAAIPGVADLPGGLRAAAVRIVKGGALAWLLAGCGVIVAVQSCAAWAPSILHRAYGLTPASAAGWVGGLTLIAAPSGHLFAGWLMSRGRVGARQPALVLAASVVATIMAGVGLAGASNLALAAAAMTGLMAASGFGAALALIAYQTYFDGALRRGANSLYFAAVTVVGSALGPAVTGAISDRSAADGSQLGPALALVTAVAGSLVLVVALLISRAGTSAQVRP